MVYKKSSNNPILLLLKKPLAAVLAAAAAGVAGAIFLCIWQSRLGVSAAFGELGRCWGCLACQFIFCYC